MSEDMICHIREMRPDEQLLLKDFLYEAVFRREDLPPYPREIIDKPAIRVYIESWGRPDDICLVALVDSDCAGAVWTRVLTADSKGFAYVDDETPELAISLYKPYRGQGIGTALMKAAIDRLKNTGYRRVSLSVSKDNPAYGLYKRLGFEVFAEDKDDYSMILAL